MWQGAVVKRRTAWICLTRMTETASPAHVVANCTGQYGVAFEVQFKAQVHVKGDCRPSEQGAGKNVRYRKVAWKRSRICAMARPAGLAAGTSPWILANRSPSRSLAATSAASRGQSMAANSSALALLSG